jgi:hypothetical protein
MSDDTRWFVSTSTGDFEIDKHTARFLTVQFDLARKKKVESVIQFYPLNSHERVEVGRGADHVYFTRD